MIMKCYTLTETGILPGIQFLNEPYPNVLIGDPANQMSYTRVEVDTELADSAKENMITSCSWALDVKEGEKRRASYKLVPPRGDDDHQAMVKVEAHCAKPGGRTSYEFPHDTFTLASGWFTGPGGSKVSAPANLVVLDKDNSIRVYKTEDIWRAQELVFAASYDGRELKLKKSGKK
jgi:hypothetical protein